MLEIQVALFGLKGFVVDQERSVEMIHFCLYLLVVQCLVFSFSGVWFLPSGDFRLCNMLIQKWGDLWMGGFGCSGCSCLCGKIAQ